MLSTLYLAQVEPALLVVRLHCSVRGSALSQALTYPEPSGPSVPPVKRQTPETSSHHSVRPISGAYHQLLGFFTLRAWS